MKSLNIRDRIVLVATVGLTGGGTTVDSKVSEIEVQLFMQGTNLLNYYVNLGFQLIY